MRILEFIARIPFKVIIGANILLILIGAAMAATYIYAPSPHGATTRIVGIEAASNNKNTPAPAPQAASSTTASSTDSQNVTTVPAVAPTNISTPQTGIVGQPISQPLPTLQPQAQPPISQPIMQPPCLETANPTSGTCSPCSCYSTGRHLCPMIMCYPICGGAMSSEIACRIY